MAEIFVSYRRDDSAPATGRIVENLERRFGAAAVFNDVFDIEGGQSFRDVISGGLAQTKVMLVVIGNRWVDAVDENGNRRLENDDDYVRFEIESGLARPDCLVIPVLVNRQRIPKKSDLPESIHELVDRNAVLVRPDPDFADDFEDLFSVIAKRVPPKKRWPLPVAVSALFVAAVVAALLWAGRDPPDTVVQIYDVLTGNQIKRSFKLTVLGEDERSEATEHTIEDVAPAGVTISNIRIKGYEFKRGTSRIVADTRGADHQLRVYLKRSSEFLNSIKRDRDDPDVKWPSDDDIKRELSHEKVPPEEVELIVRNLLEADESRDIDPKQHVDLLLLWMPPSDWKSDDPFLQYDKDDPRWDHIGTIEYGKGESFKNFGLEIGFFMVFASVNGKRAELLDRCSLYKRV